MENDPHVYIGKRVIEPILEGIIGAFRLFIALVKAWFVVLYNFIKRNI